MLREVLKGKIHRAKVTEANVDYEGSITIDKELMSAAGIYNFEKVQVLDVTNGARLETYAFEGESGSGIICLNGAAARLIKKGDIVIILSFALISEEEMKGCKPKIVLVDGENRVKKIKNYHKIIEEC